MKAKTRRRLRITREVKRAMSGKRMSLKVKYFPGGYKICKIKNGVLYKKFI